MITNVSYENLKGRTGAHALAPFTVINGRNRRGKTTITNAVMLACLGYLPALGKQNKATFRLAGGKGNSMAVTAQFKDGRSVSRTWKQGKNISATCKGEAPDIGPVLNPALFLAANSADKIALLAGLSPEGTDQATADLRKLVGQSNDPDKNLFEFAEDAAGKYEQTSRDAEGKVKQWKATMAGLVELLNASTPAKPENKAQAALEQALREETAASGEHEALEKKSEDAWGANDELQAMGDIAEVDPTALENAERTAAEAWQTANTAATKAETDLSVLRQRIQATARAIRGNGGGVSAEALGKWIQDVETFGDPTERLRAAAAESSRLGDVVRKLEEAGRGEHNDRTAVEKSIAALGELETCPTCKACAPGWKDGALKSFEAALEAVKARQTDTGAKIGPARSDLEAAVEKQKELQGHADNWRNLEDMKIQLGAKTALEQYKAQEGDLEKELETTRATAADKDAALQAVRADLARARQQAGNVARVAELRRIVAAGPPQDVLAAAAQRVTDAQMAVTSARTALAAEKQKNADYEEAVQREKDRAAAEENVAAAEKEKADAAAKAKEIRDKMKAAMKSLFGPVLKYAGPLSKAVMGTELTLNAAGEIGVQDDLAFIDFSTLSGCEQVIATIAIQAALSSLQGGVVLLDEFHRVDAENKVLLFNELDAMVKRGDLAQVIIADHDPAFAALAGSNGAAVITVA